MKFTDIDLKKWNDCREEMKEVLIARAKLRGMIAYSDLIKEVSTIRFNIDSIDHRNLLAQMLGEISLEEDRAGHGMLSAIVVHKYGDQEPGQGFFEFAKVLGHDISDRLTFWINEVKAVHSCWAVKNR
jgi:hypothetical protein